MQRLTFDIHATETECSDDGGRCRFMGGTHFGTRFVCMMFGNQELRDADGEPSGPGRLQRLPECRLNTMVAKEKP